MRHTNALIGRISMVACAAASIAGAAASAPPPPPPPFVGEIASRLKAVPTVQTFPAYAADFAEDVQVVLNGAPLLSGKADWLAYQKARIGLTPKRVMGEAESYDSIFIVDFVDDRFGVPDSADPRYVARASRYSVGPDRKIHQVLILTGGSYFH